MIFLRQIKRDFLRALVLHNRLIFREYLYLPINQLLVRRIEIEVTAEEKVYLSPLRRNRLDADKHGMDLRAPAVYLDAHMDTRIRLISANRSRSTCIRWGGVTFLACSVPFVGSLRVITTKESQVRD